MIKVMIAEDNISLCKNYFNFFSNDSDIKVVSCTEDGEETIQKYFELQPDVLLLDLNLPKISGLDVINTISRFSEEREKCNIIVSSGSSEQLHKLFNTAQIFRVIPKPTNFQYVLDTIKEIPIKNEEINQKDLKKILTELRLNVFSLRVKQLISAINIAYKYPYLLNNIKDLYLEVSKLYNVSPKTIKWSIRTSVDTLNRSLSIDTLCSVFSLKFRPETVTPKFFIALIVEYFKSE